MFKSFNTFELGPKQYLDVLFKELPSNAFINKGKCANGATQLETSNLNRCSLVVEFNTHIVNDKVYPDDRPHEERLFAVHAEVTRDQVKEFLNKRLKASKIITTPAGVKKVITAAIELGMLKELYQKWFFCFDEIHSIITEDYRKDFYYAFNQFWEFKAKCMISATPYQFDYYRMKELDYIKIKITESVGLVNLVRAKSVRASLKYIIEDGLNNDSKYFLFINCVTEIVKLLELLKLEDCRIFCSDGNNKENFQKLGEYLKFWRKQPKNDDFAKFNFFTTTSFEGWDMNIENAVVIVATDIHKSRTLVGIDKCVQALGRARKTTKALYHVFNDRNIPNYKSLKDIKASNFKQAKMIYNTSKICYNEAKATGNKFMMTSSVEKFCSITDSGLKFNPIKVEQINYKDWINEIYNHRNFINQMWQNYYYETEPWDCERKLDTTRAMARRSKSEQLKLDYLELLHCKKDNIFSFSQNVANNIKKNNPLAYDASLILNEKQMEELKYNVKKITEKVILLKEDQKRIKLFKLINLNFKTGFRYPKTFITNKLTEIFTELEVKNGKGQLWIPLATHIKKFFDVNECKIPVPGGKPTNGFQLIRSTFELKLAA